MFLISKEKLKKIQIDLLNERINKKKIINFNNENNSFSIPEGYLKEESIKELKKEGILPEDFEC